MAGHFGSLHFIEMLVAVHSISLCYFSYVCQDSVIRETGRDGSTLRSRREPPKIDSSMKRSDGEN